ncbi:MAG TPA: UDP-2,3-diacylglucosamine diphosphatase [bacterium]|nr:UDP-2,3-diacylglucosamine diphosphatase [bacterium]
MPGPVYFVADAHLGSSPDPAADRPRLDRLEAFLDRVRERRAERLYILGDLFDFWFEYAHVMPRRHVPILTRIRGLVDSGVPVTFLGGNHDWWAGRSFEEVAGMTVCREPLSVEHQGKRLYLAHGDGLASRTDSGYLMLKAVLRNPAVIALLRCVHPDLAYWFGHRLSRFSRRHLTDQRFRIADPLAEVVDARLAEGHDAFLMGHYHIRLTETRPGGGTLFMMGDWMTIYSALRLENGEFVWEDWSSGSGVDVDAAEARTMIEGGHGDEPSRTASA